VKKPRRKKRRRKKERKAKEEKKKRKKKQRCPLSLKRENSKKIIVNRKNLSSSFRAVSVYHSLFPS
jgi:hypothetical protein